MASLMELQPLQSFLQPFLGHRTKPKEPDSPQFQQDSWMKLAIRMFDTFLSLTTTMSGTSLLVISNAAASSGIVWATIQIVISALITIISVRSLLKAALHIQSFSFQEIAYEAFGFRGLTILNIFCFLINWASIIIYIELIVDLFCKGIANASGDTNSWWLQHGNYLTIFLVTSAIVLPVSLLRHVEDVRWLCLIDIITILFFMSVVIYESSNLYSTPPTLEYFTFGGFSTTFSTAIFSFQCQMNVLEICEGLMGPNGELPSMKVMDFVVGASTSFAVITTTLIAIFGYMTFGVENLSDLSDSAGGDILVAYDYLTSSATLVTVTMFIFAVSLVVSQPFNVMPARKSLESLWDSFTITSELQIATHVPIWHTRFTQNSFWFVVFSVYSAMAIVMAISKPDFLVNIVGSVLSPVICFIFPFLIEIAIVLHHDRSLKKNFRRVQTVFLLTLCLLMFIYTVYSILMFIL